MALTNFFHSGAGIVQLSDLNCYVLSYFTPAGAYAVSSNSVSAFTQFWFDPSAPLSLPPRLAYMPAAGGNPGRLFVTWNSGGSINIGELALGITGNSLTSITGLVGNPAVLNGPSTPSAPCIAVSGNQVVVAYELPDHTIDMAVSNDLVADPKAFTFTLVGGLYQADGITKETTGASPSIVAAPGGVYLAWQGYDIHSDPPQSIEDVTVGGYTVGSGLASLFYTTLQGLTDTPPALTYANNELYLLFCQPVDQHLCIWPQAHWPTVAALFLAPTTHQQPSLCPSTDGTQLVMAWTGDDTNQTINVAFQPF